MLTLTSQDDLDYMDDNAERLARKKMKTDAMKRAFAVNGESFISCYRACPFPFVSDRLIK